MFCFFFFFAETSVDISSSFGSEARKCTSLLLWAEALNALLILGGEDISNNVPSSLGEGRKCLQNSFISFYNIAKVQAQNHKFEGREVEGFYLFAFFEKELKYNMIAV